MTPERHAHIKRLFLAAAELTPGEAKQYLDSACGDDQELRREIQSLLDHHRPETLIEYAEGEETVSWQAPPPGDFSSARRTAAQESGTLPTSTMIAGRYRLVAPLGQGGMGVVYRAEDLELGQTVALKFLSSRVKELDGAVEFLRSEVRMARRITHPNVVRIFDIGDDKNELFISMEFVDGEHLESLVRRVGPLPPAKVLQIARQLAAALAAAHAAGVLHRDLKPSNVMIDGAGNLRVLDFGIAVPLSDQDALRAFGGTPGFIAPELLAGNSLTERSDLYAWGLVIYFATTGGLPGEAAEDAGPAANATLLSAGFDHTMAEYVCACLQDDPARRPNSAAEIVNGLRTGDSLREAVQAGHMPADEVVTSARTWLPAAPLVDGMFAGGLALLAVIMLLADKTLFLSRCGLVKSPDVLQDMAEQTLTSLGCRAPEGPVLTGVTVDTGGLQFIRGLPTIPAAWRKLEAGEIPVAFFWYRQGDPRLPRPAPLGESRWERLASPTPGTATVRLDGRGKLLSVQIVTASPPDEARAAGTDWSKLFESAGLPWSEFKAAPAQRLPPVFADGVQAWDGPFPADPTLGVKVTAATLGGRVVFFDVDQPWELARPDDALINSGSQSTQFVAVRIALWLIAIALAAALAWSHASLGHADWRGAWRVSAAATILAALEWLVGSPHNLVPAEELASSFLWLNLCVSYGAAAGVAYLAVEPFARRWWPWSIITTRRLVSGRLADRGIWTDLLLGMVVGLGTVLMRQLGTLINQSLSIPVSGLNDFDLGQNVLDQFGARFKMSIIVAALSGALIESLLLLTLVVALKRLTASTLASAVLMVLMLASLAIVGRGILSPIDWTVRILLWAIVYWLLLRHGLLASITALATFHAVNNAPITLNWSRWYAPTGLFVVAGLAVALTIAWRLSRPPITSPTGGRHNP